jgi:uridine phosphorylase
MNRMGERFTAAMYVNHHLAHFGMTTEDVELAPVAVLAWGRDPILALVEATGAEAPRSWPYGELYPFYVAELQGQHVCFAVAPMGAPTTVMLMEMMIACGVRAFIGLGRAGSLHPLLPVGAFVLPMTCIREEGTSAHYIDTESTVRPSSRLATMIQAACQEEGVEVASGLLWTTDAPFRELLSKIEANGREGALGVDMETSAMYALGMFRGVDVCNLLVVSDELWDVWHPGFHSPELREAEERARQVILRCLTKGLAP